MVLTAAGEEARRRLVEHVQRHSPLATLDADQQQLRSLLEWALARRGCS